MALEHRWLSRGIENAQKKVEERNFDIRKHLLEYDEVMDRQRKIFYGRRQNILESQDLREFVREMLTDSIESACDSYLSATYSYETVAEWARRNLAVQVDAVQLGEKSTEELIEFLQNMAEQAARDAIEESLPEFIPDETEFAPEEGEEGEEEAEAEPPPKADYRALAAWAETRLSVQLREADLKKLNRDEIQDLLVRTAEERLKAIDFSPLQTYLKPDFRLAALADWANKKFDLRVTTADFQGKDRDAAVRLLLDRLEKLYAEKEQSYPVESAIEEHLVAQAGMGQQNFDGLAQWASRYYLASIKADDIRFRDPREVRRKLLEISAEYHASGRLRVAVDEGIRQHMPAAALDRPESWQPLSQWTRELLGVEITPEHFALAATGGEEKEPDRLTREQYPEPLPPGEVAEEKTPLTAKEAVTELIFTRAQAVRRSRMTELERYLLLQVHDTSWKDHLLVMDHLKSGVGLRGYAQLNPLIEFKKEGLESFSKMLESAREKFTDLFFKARWVRQEALARIWAGQSTEHAAAASAYDAQREAALDMSQKSQMADEGEVAVKTIIRETPKVGRNDPCPCGSGKKYKKCCGARA
ncbi:MAG: SEC-C metal-binding domain-containing protein [Planctomycetota bacterium]|nr:SEC-C metal-binding domain-containing protein [Planctomycetota bacterium]